jgi:hypothetical protein
MDHLDIDVAISRNRCRRNAERLDLCDSRQSRSNAIAASHTNEPSTASKLKRLVGDWNCFDGSGSEQFGIVANDCKVMDTVNEHHLIHIQQMVNISNRHSHTHKERER